MRVLGAEEVAGRGDDKGDCRTYVDVTEGDGTFTIALAGIRLLLTLTVIFLYFCS